MASLSTLALAPAPARQELTQLPTQLPSPPASRSSAGNLAFWLDLCGCSSRPACQQLLQQLAAAEAADKARGAELCARFNEQLVARVGGSCNNARRPVFSVSSSS